MEEWIFAPEHPVIRGGEVHIWRVELGCSQEKLTGFKPLLSPDEIKRADSFLYPDLASRFVAARAILRSILSGYLGKPAREITFRYNEFGKPLLGLDSKGYCFNLAHSNDYAVIAIALDSRVGIDLEEVRSDFDLVDIAKRFFASIESASLLAFPSEERVDAFFRCWTRKEAFIKAKGKGLSIDLQEFTVSLDDVERSRILSKSGEEKWNAFHFRPFPGYVAALAAEGDPHLRFMQLKEDR